MTVIDTLLVDGTDISIAGARIAEDFSGVHAVAARRGSNYTVPGRHGEIYTPKPLAALPFPLGLVITPADPATGIDEATEQERIARLWSNYRALVALVKADGDGDARVTLTRVLSLPGGGSVSETCTAEVPGGMTPVVAGGTMRVVVDFVNLDGRWTEIP